MGKNRSTILIGIGVAVFVVGASLAFLAVRSGGDDNSPRVQTAATVPVSKPGQVTGSDAAGAPVAVFEIPTGKQAVAVQVGYVQGVAGFVKSGDKVNVFGTVKPGSPAPKGLPAAPAARLILSDVTVLSASAPAVGGPATYVLALNAADAEQVVYLMTFEGLYFSLARSDQGILSTPGRSSGSPF